jgi:glucose/mannose transport system substrate-binding protein
MPIKIKLFLSSIAIAFFALILALCTNQAWGLSAISAFLVAFFATLVLQWLALSWLLRPMDALLNAMIRLQQGGGDLNLRIPSLSSDEFSLAASGFNQFSGVLQTTFREVQRDMEGLSLGLKEITAVTGQLVKDSHTQADFASASAAAVEEISVSITHIADSADEVDNVVAGTQQLSNESARAVSSVSDEVSKMGASITTLAQAMAGLSKRSQEIGSIVNVIKDIAEQTNLLALNAAIEAARAGEQGRGFAVVADEVRKLAERSARATVEITERIDAVSKETQIALQNMDRTANGVATSVGQAKQASQLMQDIGQRMDNVVEVVRSETFVVK